MSDPHLPAKGRVAHDTSVAISTCGSCAFLVLPLLTVVIIAATIVFVLYQESTSIDFGAIAASVIKEATSFSPAVQGEIINAATIIISLITVLVSATVDFGLKLLGQLAKLGFGVSFGDDPPGISEKAPTFQMFIATIVGFLLSFSLVVVFYLVPTIRGS